MVTEKIYSKVDISEEEMKELGAKVATEIGIEGVIREIANEIAPFVKIHVVTDHKRGITTVNGRLDVVAD